MSRMNSKGFTLIELVMVIVILGILAAVAIPKFANISDKARSATFKSAVGAVKSGIVSKFASSSDNSWPDSLSAVNSSDAYYRGAQIIDTSDFYIVVTDPATTTKRYGTVTAQTGEQPYYVEDKAGYYVEIAYDSTNGQVRSPNYTSSPQ